MIIYDRRLFKSGQSWLNFSMVAISMTDVSNVLKPVMWCIVQELLYRVMVEWLTIDMTFVVAPFNLKRYLYQSLSGVTHVSTGTDWLMPFKTQ